MKNNIHYASLYFLPVICIGSKSDNQGDDR